MNKFDALRLKALQGTKHELSRELLENFHRLVAHPGTAGSGYVSLHYQDYDLRGAICASSSECMILYELVSRARPARVLEIGSYVGWTSAHLASALGPEGILVCIDPFTEIQAGLPELAAQHFRDNMNRAGLERRIKLIIGSSPGALDYLIPFDFIFIDGWHWNNQPMRDVQGVLAHCWAWGAPIILHDLHAPHVQQAARWLIQDRYWKATIINTANYLTVCWEQEPDWWEKACGDLSKYALGRPRSIPALDARIVSR